MQTEEILEKLREYKAERGDAYGIETLGLFGSKDENPVFFQHGRHTE